ncbi:MAG: ribulose-phosphate 3-epimerase [Polyangiaceae bacterium]|nr:ribulose-phosphate 3-epimerase [Polyangiaceae bacterium]
MQNKVRIAPSILAADLTRLGEELRDVEQAGADWIHVDVMDGRFVPNISLGPVVVAAARRTTSLPLDVHLMIEEPYKYLTAFANAGADIMSVHLEATTHLKRNLAEIRRLGKRAGVVLNPHTPEEALRYVLEDVDLVLVLTVNPGFGGQSFMPSMLPKIQAVREMIDRSGLVVDLEVDGGMSPETAPLVVQAGADVIVAGESVFGNHNHNEAISALRAATELARPRAQGMK